MIMASINMVLFIFQRVLMEITRSPLIISAWELRQNLKERGNEANWHLLKNSFEPGFMLDLFYTLADTNFASFF